MLLLCPDLAAQNVSVAADHGGARLAVVEGAGHVGRPVQVLAAAAVQFSTVVCNSAYLPVHHEETVPAEPGVGLLAGRVVDDGGVRTVGGDCGEAEAAAVRLLGPVPAAIVKHCEDDRLPREALRSGDLGPVLHPGLQLLL